MVLSSDAPLGYQRLLNERLQPGETLDGIIQGPIFTAAITAERLLIIGPIKPNGWEMKSVPWRFVSLVTDGEPEENKIQLRCSRPPSRRSTGSNADAAVAAPPDPEEGSEMTFTLPEDGGHLIALLSARTSLLLPA